MNSDLMTSGMADMARAQVYTDFNAMHDMRRAARDNPDAALEEVARQFESIFIKMMLKQMRQASLGDPIFSSHSADMYRDMFDDQLAVHMSQQQGMGLADMLVRQLKQQRGDWVSSAPGPRPAPRVSRSGPAPDLPPRQEIAAFDSPRHFVNRLWPLAQQAADELGTRPEVILAQAALETGWGRHVIRDARGDSSHNLFNIKADSRWSGPRVHVTTLEFDGPVASRQKAAFRAYDSYAESFRDYVDFLKTNPRYGEALNHAADAEMFARKLHEAGYATDPDYADKVVDIMGRDIVRYSQPPESPGKRAELS